MSSAGIRVRIRRSVIRIRGKRTRIRAIITRTTHANRPCFHATVFVFWGEKYSPRVRLRLEAKSSAGIRVRTRRSDMRMGGKRTRKRALDTGDTPAKRDKRRATE